MYTWKWLIHKSRTQVSGTHHEFAVLPKVDFQATFGESVYELQAEHSAVLDLVCFSTANRVANRPDASG